MTNANSNSQINSSSIKSPANKGSDDKQPSKQGFASMDPERRRVIAAEGGRASHSGSGSKSGSVSSSSSSSGRSDSKGDSSKSASKTDGKGVQGGTPEQHAEAGRQSHKNTR